MVPASVKLGLPSVGLRRVGLSRLSFNLTPAFFWLDLPNALETAFLKNQGLPYLTGISRDIQGLSVPRHREGTNRNLPADERGRSQAYFYPQGGARASVSIELLPCECGGIRALPGHCPP